MNERNEEEKKHYENCLKFRKLIEENFEISTAGDSYVPVRRANIARVVTKDGMVIEYSGTWFTKEEKEEIDRDHAEGDAMDFYDENEVLNSDCAQDDFTKKEVK